MKSFSRVVYHDIAGIVILKLEEYVVGLNKWTNLLVLLDVSVLSVGEGDIIMKWEKARKDL